MATGAIRRVVRELLGLVFPARCGGCRRVVPAGDGAVCPQCAARALELVSRSYCNLCGQDSGPFALRAAGPGVAVCGQCDESLYRYDALVRAGAYVEPLDAIVRTFKYHGGHHLAAMLGAWQSARLAGQPWLDSLDALVPVPLHWRRRLGRGFNQSDLLARFIGRRVGKPVADCLCRPVHRPPQAALPKSLRFENVRGVFAVRRPGRVAGRSFCLIDDVCTTGATLSEAARTLRRAGAAKVYACVVAVAQPPAAFSQPVPDPL